MQYWTHRHLWNLIPCVRKGSRQLSESAAPWGRGRAYLLPGPSSCRAISARSHRCCHLSQQWHLALILNWKFMEMRWRLLAWSWSRVCSLFCNRDRKSIQRLLFIFIWAEAKWYSLGNQHFPCFACACGTAVAICLAFAGSKGQWNHCSAELQQELLLVSMGKAAPVLLLWTQLGTAACLPSTRVLPAEGLIAHTSACGKCSPVDFLASTICPSAAVANWASLSASSFAGQSGMY